MARTKHRRTTHITTEPRGTHRPAVEPLEGRRLLSLVVSLETPAGATSAVVTAGEVLTLDVIATVTSPDGATTDDKLQDVAGSFLSTAVGTSAVAGNLSASTAAPFDALGSADGTIQDLNSDGNLDVGSSDTTSSSLGGYFLARADQAETNGTVADGAMSFQIATVTYTVTALNGGGQTNINFAPRNTSSLPGTVAAVWTEDDAPAGTDEKTGTFRAGSPFQVYATVNQAAATTGTVTATVYDDANGNGAQDAGEAGLAGATVYVDVGQGYTTNAPSAQTNASGVATITGVPAGSYAVRVVPPTGFSQTQPASTGDYIVAVTAGHTTAAGGTFGAEPDGSVSGSVYIDANGNGTQDTGEGADGAGTVIDLESAGGATTLTSTTTAAGGTFTFADVVPGAYTVAVEAPTGYAATQPVGGTDAVTVAPAGAVTGQTFGIAPAGSITGTVYDDANGNGARDAGDAGEAGLAGVTVYVDVNGDGVDDAGDVATTTAGDGTFTLSPVQVGTFPLRVVVPAGDTLTAPAGGSETVTVTAEAVTAAAAFGIDVPAVTTPTATTGTISGTAYVDANGDGADDAGDTPRAGATIYLDANGNGVLDPGEVTATTAADGTYAFTGLTPGAYTVRQLVPLGYVATAPAAGSYAFTVTAGGTDADNDFGADPLPTSPLTVALLSRPAATAIAGVTSQTLKVRVTDGSTAPFAGPLTVDAYASTTGVPSTQDAPAGTATDKSVKLKAGKFTTITVKFTYPASLATGTYQLVMAALSGDTTAPALGAATTVAVATPAVDLSPAIVARAVGVTVKQGKRATASVRVTNSGNVTAVGTVTVTIYSTLTGTVDGSAVSLGTVTGHKIKIAAGKSAVVAVPFTAPATAMPGAYQLVAVITPTTSPADDNAADDTSVAVATR